ncbi:MAG: S8 family serine peptidase [Candidatus Delongbacteria bacterium]
MKRCLTLGSLVLALAGAAAAGQFSAGLERLAAGRSADEALTVLLSLREQADIAGLDADLHARRATRAARHEAVVRSLKERAASSQQDLLRSLEQLRRTGKVQGYTSYWITNAVLVKAPLGVLRELAARADVALVEPELLVELIDPILPATPGERAPGDGQRTPEPGVLAVRAQEVWNQLGVTGSGALVGGIDTGVLGTHAALSSRWRGNNGHPTAECWLDAAGLGHTTPNDGHGHGTHTMGTMVGGAPGLEVGVAPGAQWIASNCINMSTGGGFDNAVIASFQFMADPDDDPGTIDDVPDVVQNSWGVNEGFSGYFDCDSRWWAAIDNCEAAGVCVTWSAGNEGPSATTLRSPGDRALTPYNCFSVGATDPTAPYTIASFSSRGPSGCGGAFAMKPEVSAPGVDTYSCYNNGSYTTMSGTSMAGPHVAGVVALMRSANPDIEVDAIKQILMDTAVDLGPAGEDNAYGHGFVDAYEAVLAALSGFNDTYPPNITPASLDQVLAAQPQTVGAQITDASGLASVTLAWRLPEQAWNNVAMTQSGSSWSGQIPGQTGGSVVEYFITAVDGSENANSASTSVASYAVYTLLFAEGFNGTSTFTHEGGGGLTDQWHLESARAYEGTQSWKFGGTGSANYADNAGGVLSSPVLTLPAGATEIVASVRSWLAAETSGAYPDSCYDGGVLQLSLDGGPWQDALPSPDYTHDLRNRTSTAALVAWLGVPRPMFSGSADWTRLNVNVPFGTTTVQLRWLFGTDTGTTREGWYLDDFKLLALLPVSAGLPVNDLGIVWSGGVVTLNWSPQPGALAYRVYGGTQPWDVDPPLLGEVPVPGFQLNEAGSMRFYQVRVVY